MATTTGHIHAMKTLLPVTTIILGTLLYSPVSISALEQHENDANWKQLHDLLEASHAEEERKRSSTHVSFECSHGDCPLDPASPTWEKWHLSGSSSIYGRGLILTQDAGGQSGSVWMLHPYEVDNFDIEFRYRVSGKNEYGADGMALWFTEGGIQDRFSVSPEEFGKRHAFGHSASWNGLGVFFDTFDNEGTGKGGLLGIGSKHPRVISIVNDGSFYWDHELEKIVNHVEDNNDIKRRNLMEREAQLAAEMNRDQEEIDGPMEEEEQFNGRHLLSENSLLKEVDGEEDLDVDIEEEDDEEEEEEEGGSKSRRKLLKNRFQRKREMARRKSKLQEQQRRASRLANEGRLSACHVPFRKLIPADEVRHDRVNPLDGYVDVHPEDIFLDNFIRVTYYERHLNVFTGVAKRSIDEAADLVEVEWKTCSRLHDVHLPKSGYFGFTASTGDLSDKHEVVSFRLMPFGEESTMEVDHAPLGEDAMGEVPPVPEEGGEGEEVSTEESIEQDRETQEEEEPFNARKAVERVKREELERRRREAEQSEQTGEADKESRKKTRRDARMEYVEKHGAHLNEETIITKNEQNSGNASYFSLRNIVIVVVLMAVALSLNALRKRQNGHRPLLPVSSSDSLRKLL